jgi:hypothetical protein
VPLRPGLRLGLRRPTLATLALGAALAALAQVALPIGAPVYDGVTVAEPYRFLSPAPNHAGSPGSFTQDYPVTDGRSPEIAASTTENPPQAQVIAPEGAFTIPAGVTSVRVSITPVPAATAPAAGQISGNAYRVEVTDPSGQALAIAGSQRPTLAMRAPGLLADATIERLASGGWQRLDTVADASLAIYTTELAELGDFAVVDLAGAGGVSTTDLVIGGTIGAVALAVAAWGVRVWLGRRALAARAEADAARRRRGSVRPRRR